MLSTLFVVLPIFALVFAGWFVRRIGVLGPHATSELNRFVVYLALPALLFDIVAHASWAELWLPGFAAVFGLGSFAIFGLTICLRRPQHLADCVLDGLNAGYSNAGFVGFPLVLVALGREALAPTLIAVILTVCVMFATAIILIKVGLQTEARRGRLALKVGGSLLRNPLLAAPVLGGLVALSGLAIPAPAETFLKLLGGAASPCALVALGLFLAADAPGRRSEGRIVSWLVAAKLLAHPAITWVLAVPVFHLPPLLAHTAVLLAALPTGTGPFMLAEFYRREAAITSRTVLASTVLSVLTTAAYLATTR